MKDLSTKHFVFIDGLRGVLALYVVGHHLLGWHMAAGLPLPLKLIGSAFAFGHAAVCAFIVLSGFSLMLPVASSADGRARGGFGKYIKRRAWRILPAYYAALVLSAGAVALASRLDPNTLNDLSPTSIISHLLLIHTWVPGQSGTINMALWSVATEWHIYFLFPLVLLPVWRRGGTGVLIVVAFALGIIPQFVLAPGNYFMHACPWFVGLFATGMAAAVAVDASGSSRKWPSGAIVLGIGAFVVYLALKLISPTTDIASGATSIQWAKDGLCGSVVACLLVACTRRSLEPDGEQGRQGVVLGALESGVCRRLGLLSYSLYATHCAVFTLLRAIATRAELGPSASFALMGLVGIPVCIGLAHVFALCFEVPFLSPRGRPPELSVAVDSGASPASTVTR